MGASIYDFDTTAANNTSVDGISQAENVMRPPAVNNAFRALDAILARFCDDLGAVNTVGGTADAITVTLSSGITAYATGQLFRFVAASANTGAATINVNAIGAKAVRKISGGTDVALSSGDIAAGETYLVRYDAAANSAAGAWILVGSSVAAASTTAAGIVELATPAEALAASSSALALTPASIASLIQNINNQAFKIADLDGARLNMAGGIADAYDSETDVDTATSTNESYDSTNDLYSPSPGANVLINVSGMTSIGAMTNGGGLAAAFDGNTSQTWTSGARSSSANSADYIGKTFGTARAVAAVKVYPSTDEGYTNGANCTLTLYAKNGSAPASRTDGTVIGSLSQFSDDTTARTITSSSTATWDHAWISMTTTTGSASMYVAELEFYETGSPNNMTLVSNAFTATAVPTVARIATFIDPQVSITINTDFTAEVSRDGGTTWTAVTLALVSNPVGTVEQYEGTVSISSQPSGSSMKYRLKTLNNKDIDVTGTVFQWG